MADKIITKQFGLENVFQIDVYLENNGYAAVKKALTGMKSDEILQEVKAANLRGFQPLLVVGRSRAFESAGRERGVAHQRSGRPGTTGPGA